MYWSPFGGALLPALNKNAAAPNENFNLCIAGVPGSGKSVFMQELMLSVLGVGGKVFVLDYGRSFKRTCLILGGSYIEFDMKNPVSINPFSEVPEDDSAKSIEARSDFLSNFPSILATMAAPQYGTSDLQQQMLQMNLTLALLSIIYSICSFNFSFNFSTSFTSFCYISALNFC
ncbi:ftsK/SpoIIIE family protein [Orientia tsutsugamushi str. Gilliam]|uniref:Conjugal transfer protein TraC n=1 Tax=Orientia tsutsugamushi str. Gilliam TaxID=1359184 RepID=A0A0F3M6S6_ORITS|nr:ftsK/SpoIIIE family protein [Orientia tsutsugamushi str. Gilliam]SPR03358.1 conjugal transfer protein TraC [Orientia tsutsugamushi str. Gilliam]SPR03641.1 conjugal transfer protein TraC [Orientia tsutsugamushi str. Gilliam]